MADRCLGSMIWEDEGEGEVVLMIHGLGGSSNSFQTLVPSLTNHRILRIDLPGAGRSRYAPGQTSMSTLVSAVKNCLTASSVSKVHVVGHSMGSLIAQHLAVQLPDRVDSLTLFGAIDQPSDTARLALQQRAQQARGEGMTDIAQSVCRGSICQKTDNASGTAEAFVRESLMRQDPNGYAAHCEALADANRASHEAIKCPTLIVAGSEDPVSPPPMAQKLHGAIADSELQTLDGIGHWIMIEAAAKSGSLLQRHLTK